MVLFQLCGMLSRHARIQLCARSGMEKLQQARKQREKLTAGKKTFFFLLYLCLCRHCRELVQRLAQGRARLRQLFGRIAVVGATGSALGRGGTFGG